MDSGLACLPAELWLHVFEALDSTRDLYSHQHSWFQPRYEVLIDCCQEARRMHVAIALVCREWHELIRPRLFREVVLGANYVNSYPQHVEVCTVPYSETVTTSYTAPRVKSTLDILSTFVNLGTLVRHRGIGSDDLFFDFFANVHPLPECLRGLRRVDWFLFGYANSSCGLNSLYDVLEQIPQLEYLTLDGFPHTNLLPPKVLHMPRLVILRLVRVNMTLSSRIGQWSLPSLRHVIVEQLHRDERLAAIWASHPHIQTIEQGQHLNLLIRDNISFLLRSTQIKQLGYYVRFAKVPDNAPMRETLEVVHWQGASNMALESPVSHVVGHIRFLRNSELLPSLKKLVLHGGDWSTLLLNTQITSSLAILHAERPQVEIKFSNGRPVVFGTTSMV